MSTRAFSNPVVFSRAVVARVTATVSGLRADVILKTDGAGWILDQFCRQLQTELSGELSVQAVRASAVGLRRRIIHFMGSECFFDPNWSRRYHHSNAMIGLWWHGSDTSLEPSIRAAAQRVETSSRRLARVHVTCSISGGIVRHLGVPEEKIVLVPMGVDATLYRPPDGPSERASAKSRLGLPADSLVVGSFQKDGVGWGDGDEPKLIKGPDVFARVVARLAERHRVVALIPGPARGYLKRELQAAGVSFRADGFVQVASMRDYYLACDMYLMTGREEGGPAATLEALACGVPFVGHRSGMAPDVITDGVTGYLADIDDVEELVRKADRLLRNPGLRSEFANAGLLIARAYAWSHIAPMYERLYKSIRPS